MFFHFSYYVRMKTITTKEAKTLGVQGFIQDDCAAQKNKNRRQFGELIKKGTAKAMDASMFHGLARNSKVRYRDEEF